MRNLSIQCVFLNNLIFQLFNHFILPSSMLVRLVNIYMFRCNNKMLFVTSSFVGWLIGHILFMKWVGLILVWIQQNNSLRSNKYIRSNKYLVSELRNSMARIFSILLFITCVYSLGRIPSPIFTKKLKETSETEEREERGEETDVEIETTSETKGTKQEQEGSTEEDPSSSLFSEEKENPDKIDETEEIRVNGKEKTKDEFHFHFKETCYKNRPVYETFYLDGNQENSKLEIFLDKKDKDLVWFEKPRVTILFDYKWNRPFRYIKNDQFKNAVRKEMSQYFFSTCRSDGKERISFTYPPSLSTFLEMIQRKMSLFTTEKLSSDELYNHWNYNNEQKKKNLSNEFINRVEVLDKGFHILNRLEKKTRLYNDETKKEYLPKIYDPFLSGLYRGKVHFFFSPSIINEISIKNYIEMLWINKIYLILLISNYQEFEPKMDLEDRIKILKFLFDNIIVDSKNKKIRKKFTGIKKEISKQIPRWSYKLIDDLEQQEGENEENAAEDHEIRSRKAKRVVIFTDNQENPDPDTYHNSKTKDTTNFDKTGEVALIRYSQQSDFRRDIIKGSMRTQRRKIAIWKLFQANLHSPLFLDRIDKFLFFAFDNSELMKIMFINLMCKNAEFTISDSTYTDTEEKTKESDKKEKEEDKNKREEDKRKEKVRIEIAETWDSIIFAQVIRGCALIIQSILRKYILLPSLIIAKNSIRMLLFQIPEWSEDLKDWNREMHVKCTYNGVPLSETEFPKNWLTDGIQIKILFPFQLQPWHRYKFKFPYKDPIKKKRQKNDFSFLTVLGMEAELPFGPPRKGLSLFEPILKKLKKKMRKLKKNGFLTLRIFKEKRKLFLHLPKETKNWFSEGILFLRNKFSKSKRNPILLFGFREVYELNSTKNEKDSPINNRTIHKFSTSIRSMDWINYSLTEKKMKDLNVRTKTIINQIEKITKEKKKRFLTSERNISPNKLSSNAKRLKLKSSKNILQILKINNAQLVHKSYFSIKIWIEKIYIDILLAIINIPKINVQFFLESPRKMINKYIYMYNKKENHKRIDETNQNTLIDFISIIKKELNSSNINKNSQIFYNVTSLSQAYVFYKLSQVQVINLYKLRSVFQYHVASLFLKNEIKDYFEVQGRFQFKLKDTNFRNSVMNEWKNWVRSNYQYKYDLSQIRWSRLISQKWRNRMNQLNQRRMIQNKDLNKWNLYEKDQLIHYEKQNNFEVDSLSNQKDNFKKYYKYNILLYKSINYEDKKDSSIYELSFQLNNKQKIFYNYKIDKSKLFDMLGSIPVNKHLEEDDIIDTEKSPHRKYLDWRILHFCLRKKVEIKSWIDTRTKQKKNLFDWMGMNEEILDRPISNLEFSFFPKFVILYNAYKIKSWVIPIKLLLLNFNGNKNVSENKKINRKKNNNPFISISSNETKSIKLKNQNHEEKESEDQVNLESVLANREKNVEEDYTRSDEKKHRKKKQYKSNTEAELDFLLKRYLCFQLKWNDSLNQKIINNIKVYCLLLRLTNPREIILSSIQRGELSLDILMIQKDLTLTELMKKGIFIIESTRLSVKNDGKFIMYQTINSLLVHKRKQQINQRYREKTYIDKNNFTESIVIDQSLTRNKDKKNCDLLVPENLLSSKHRRELRILISFNSKNGNDINTEIFNINNNNIKNCAHIIDKSKGFNRDKNKLIKFKIFLFPNYRLEDLACINRYWFDTNNASRFSMVRIHICPRFKIR
uniref:Protein TIC 214 n=1 Tax=Homalium paniculiflorum TaxID=2664490 RepID=A0A5Q0RXJ1_9ROSI|nr:Ycf1-like protein [Homalium paniculiflorum]QGA46992.1 Ycf1-like protein [Homalium paniculiflorum]